MPIFLLDCLFFLIGLLELKILGILVYYVYCKQGDILSRYLEEVKVWVVGIAEWRVLEVESTAITKNLMQEYFWNVAGAAKDAYLRLERRQVKRISEKEWNKMGKKTHGVSITSKNIDYKIHSLILPQICKNRIWWRKRSRIWSNENIYLITGLLTIFVLDLLYSKNNVKSTYKELKDLQVNTKLNIKKLIFRKINLELPLTLIEK